MAKKIFMTGSSGFLGKEVIVLTGGTGFLGRNWIPKILESNPDCELYIISRTSSKDKLSGILQDMRVKLIEGDVLNPNVIKHDSERNYLIDRITRFYHTVSSTSFFERERKQTFETNVGGTERVIKFLEQCPSLKKIIYISTAYTKNGLQAKTAKEDFIPERQIAGNPATTLMFSAIYQSANELYGFKRLADSKEIYRAQKNKIYFNSKENIPLDQVVDLFRLCKVF